MNTIIDTINDALFKHRETIKNLNEEKEELLHKLCSNHQTVEQIKYRVSQLESELKALYNQNMGAKEPRSGLHSCASVSERYPDSDKNLQKRQD